MFDPNKLCQWFEDRQVQCPCQRCMDKVEVPTFKVEYMGIEGCMAGQSWLVSSETRDEQIWVYPDCGEFMGILYSSRYSDYECEKLWRENFEVLVADLLRMGADITDFNLVAEYQPLTVDMFSPEVA